MYKPGDLLKEHLSDKIKNPECIDDLAKDSYDNGIIRDMSHYRWIKDYFRVANEIEKGSLDQDKYGIFWIRLHGMLAETIPWIEKNKNFYELFELKNRLPLDVVLIYEKSFLVLENLKKMRSLFAYEELIFLDYARQTQCHVNQNCYRYRVDKKSKKIIYDYKPKTTGKKETVKKMDEIIESLIGKYELESIGRFKSFESFAVREYYKKTKKISEHLNEMSKEIITIMSRNLI